MTSRYHEADFPGLKQKKFGPFLGFLKIQITVGCTTDCDENVITSDNSLPRPKSVCDGLYEPLVIGLNVAVNHGIARVTV